MTSVKTIDEDYILHIDYDPLKDDLSSTLEALANIVKGHSKTNSILSNAFDQQLTSTIKLEKIERGSIKLFIKTVLKNTNKEEIKDKGLTAVVRQAMVEAREVLLEYMDSKEKIENKEELQFIKKAWKKIADKTPEKNTVGIDSLSDRAVSEAIQGLSLTDKGVKPEQKVKVIVKGEEHEVNRNFRCKDKDIEKIISNPEQESRDVVKKIRVKKLAYEGDSKWAVQDTDGHNYDTKITDNIWLSKFQNNELLPSEYPYPKAIISVKCDIVILRDNSGIVNSRKMDIKNIIAVDKDISNNQIPLIE